VAGSRGQEHMADGDGTAQLDDGEGGDGGDGEVVGQSEVVVEEAGDGFADPLAGALVGDFDRAFGGGALENYRFKVQRFTVHGCGNRDNQSGEGEGKEEGEEEGFHRARNSFLIFLKRRSMRKKRRVSVKGFTLDFSVP
jgi:hypothetical protein